MYIGILWVFYENGVEFTGLSTNRFIRAYERLATAR